MLKELRVEELIKKVQRHDIYIKEMMQLNLAEMRRVKFSRHNSINVNSASSEVNTDEEDAKNAEDDCEHEECHRVRCRFEERQNQITGNNGEGSLVSEEVSCVKIPAKLKKISAR